MFSFFLRCQPDLRLPALAMALFCTTALSQPAVSPSGPLTLRDAQQLAVARSAQLMARSAAIQSAREMAVSAGQLPDPVLKLGVDNLPINGPDRLSLGRDFMTMRRIGLMQEFPRSEKRKLKSEQFERNADRARAERELTLASVQQSTTMAWLERYYAQAMRELLQQQKEETRLQEQGAEIAFRQGTGTQADVFAARSALVELDDRLDLIDRQAKSASLMLVRWIGPDASRPLTGKPAWTTVWDSTDPGGAISQSQLRLHPKLALSAVALEAAETEARLAQANTQPDWTIEAAYQQRGSSFSNMVSIGVSIPLQWNQKNRQSREIAAKSAQVDEARANDEDALRAYEAEVRNLINDWQTGKDRVARYTSQMIPVAEQRTAATLTAYRVGKSDLVSVLNVRREEINTRIQALTAEMETARSWAQLNYLKPDNSIVPSVSNLSDAKNVPSKGQP